MKKIVNPWRKLAGYNCFGCSPDNEYGVKMEFYEDGDEVVSIWKPDEHYQGFCTRCTVEYSQYCWTKFVDGSCFVSCRRQE